MSYKPIFNVTPKIIKYLGKIEASREIIDDLPLTFNIERDLRKEASARMTHYSTKIEGNRLTLKQTRRLLSGEDVIAREIDKREARNYYDCLEWIYKAAEFKKPISQEDIKIMHGIIQKGIVKGKLRGEYRESQNAIYDTSTRKAVYFPPEAKDINSLMKSFVKWLNQKDETHAVIMAGIAHYQLVTIHPFMDGNGRTARALVTLMLHRERYDLKQFYSLEEYYVEDLKGYYDAIHKCQGHIYYDNPEPDITNWLEYFVEGAAVVFEEIKDKVISATKEHGIANDKENIELLQSLGPREKRALGYFSKNFQIRTKDLSSIFKIKDRTARDLLAKWISAGLIKRQGGGKRDAYYVLSEDYRQLIGSCADKR